MQPENIRVVVVDSYEPWRRFVGLALMVKPYIQIVAEAGDGTTALEKIAEYKPEIVILDVCLPDIAGLEIADRIMKLSPATRVLFLTGISSEAVVKEVLRTGASGYVLKCEAARDLVPAVEALLANDYFVSLGAIRSSFPDAPRLGKGRFDT